MGRVPRNQKGQSNMPGLVTAREDRGLKGQGERRESWKGFPDRRGGPRSRPAQPSLQGGNQNSAYSVYSLFCHIFPPHYISHWLNCCEIQEATEPVSAVGEDHCPLQNKGGEKEKQGRDLEEQTEDPQLKTVVEAVGPQAA